MLAVIPTTQDVVTVIMQNNEREYRFILRKDNAGGVQSFPLNKKSDELHRIHVMNANASMLVQDADELLTPEQAKKVKAIIALVME